MRRRVAQMLPGDIPRTGRAHTVQAMADEFGVTPPTIYRHLHGEPLFDVFRPAAN